MYKRNIGARSRNHSCSGKISIAFSECVSVALDIQHAMRVFCFVFFWRFGPTRAMASSFLRFLDHTQRRITVGRTPLDEWSARRRDLYLTTYNTHYRQTSMPPVGFELTISASERPQTYALDRAGTGTGAMRTCRVILSSVACLALAHVSKLSHQRHDFPINVLYIKSVLIFSITFVRKTFLILWRNRRDMSKNVHWSPCQVPVILLRF